MAIFDWIAIPLGYILHFIYKIFGNYFVSIFLFTLLVRLATFPLSLKSQKAQAQRAKLAPRLERLQKKYGQDRQKLQQKQMELYEKNGVSMTGGCLPMVIQMVILFGIISAIYKPLTHLVQMPSEVINASISAVTLQEGETDPNKFKATDLQGYYGELRMLSRLEENEADIKEAIGALDEEVREEKSADDYIQEMQTVTEKFTIFGQTMLQNPGEGGFKNISVLWLIPLFSCLTAMASSLISLYFTKQAQKEKQPGQGCTNVMLIAFMPLFSLYITFMVPGGVGIYWICSNLIAIVQTIVLNNIYNPAKIRAQAEAEYEERRKKRAEDKKRLAEARKREQSEMQKMLNEQNGGNNNNKKKNPQKKGKPNATAKKPEEKGMAAHPGEKENSSKEQEEKSQPDSEKEDEKPQKAGQAGDDQKTGGTGE